MMNEPNNIVTISRPPRIQPELPFDEIEIPKPPEKEDPGFSQLIQLGLPLLTIMGYILVSSMGGGRSPWMLIPMALSVVGSVIFSIYSYRKDKQKRAEIERAYGDQLVELSKEMNQYHDLQRRFYRYNYPDKQSTLRIVKNSRADVQRHDYKLRSETRLWERRVADADFGVVRLGMGTLPSTVTYVLTEVENFEDPQVREALKLAEDSRFVADIPVIISLRQSAKSEPDKAADDETPAEEGQEAVSQLPTPVTHALGVAGIPTAVEEFSRALLAQYTIFHAPMDAKLYVLGSKRAKWGWVEQLPHSIPDDQNQYCYFLDQKQDDEKQKLFGNEEGSELDQYLEGLRKTLAQRKIRLQDRESESKGDPTLPLLLVVIDLLEAIYEPDSPLNDLEADAAVSILIEEGASLGAAVVFLVPERSKVPSGCQAVIEIERTTPATNSRIARAEKLHFRYAETGVNSYRYVGVADYVTDPRQMIGLASRLANTRVQEGFGANLNKSVPFMDLMGYDSMADLDAQCWQNWQISIQKEAANWLTAKLGFMSGNKPRTLTFSAKKDGVHGMVAGSTGSGKSELLISMITAMAVTYDPSVLNFVLVDYKGGGAFKEFDALPHCVDIITNLEGDGVTRMFTAIASEMQRRQKLNVDTSTKNIVDYRQKGYHEVMPDGSPGEPYPYLFIIIDEFAEMIADRSEFRDELESITRVGRAQGVSLILAAQRPSGVTDQMRSNIKFRICLRVETPSESREMLRRNDAAYLPSGIPGRGYLQVGNEEIELVQVAYAGEKYISPDRIEQAKVIWPERQGGYDPSLDQEPPELYKAIIGSLGRLSKNHGRPVQKAPWPEFLPQHITLSQILVTNDSDHDALTSPEYLDQTAFITLGHPAESTLTLNPAINTWLNGENGWLEGSALDWAHYALRPVVGLVDNPFAAKQLPLTIDFQRGHVVMFGASGWGKSTFVRSLVVSLAATHSPDQLHMYILDLGGRSLGVLEELPHVGSVINPDGEGYEERVEQLLRELDNRVEERKILLNNAGITGDYTVYNAQHPQEPLTAVVVAIDNFVEFMETFGGNDDGVESVLDKFIDLGRQAKRYGIHFVITMNRISGLSSQVLSLFSERLTLKLAEMTEYRPIIGSSVSDIADIAGRGYVKIGPQALSFQVAEPFDSQQGGATPNELLRQLAQSMNDYIERASHSYALPSAIDALPKTILFKQILARQLGQVPLDEQFLGLLHDHAQKNWADSLDPQQADWLKVTLGVISGNRPRTLVFEAKKDGVHGLIAGGTGSGKSEMLMTLIVGLALNYDPSVLNFVLVDYKGGGAFKPFENLPHCVDSISNLNKSAVQRMFTAINAEMMRRQALNADTGTKDIVEYRQKGYHLTREPYPHLFIIIDEYAEMISDSPAFKDELESITRVGRAQGVNLLLASQRPVGVTDQMRANIKYRLCLRVEGIDTSREMLRRSDAAFLPNGMPGRGYLQIGNENIELIQVAYTGEPYPFAPVAEGGTKPNFYDVVVKLAQDLLAEKQAERPYTPWPPFLPKQITLSTELEAEYTTAVSRTQATLGRHDMLAINPFMADWFKGQVGWHGVDWHKNAMCATIGLVDDPYNAHQLPLSVDLTRGHYILFGASGWGKTTFIRTLVTSLACTHTPDEFQAHLLDLGGRNLEPLRDLPHVGTIIMPDERGYEERVQQILRELNDMVDERKRLFSEAGVSTLYEYNGGDYGRVLPAVLVAIDNFTEFLETFGNLGGKKEDDSIIEAFVTMARQARAFGVHFIITTDRLNSIPSKLYSLFTERLTLRLADADQYRTILGATVPEIEEIPGRGYVKIGRQPLEFQVAVAVGYFNENEQLLNWTDGQALNENQQIRRLGQIMQEIGGDAWSGPGPLRIDALPNTSLYRQVLAHEWGLKLDQPFLPQLQEKTTAVWEQNSSAEQADWLQVPLGITSGNRIRGLALEAKKDGVHGLVAGGTGSGKSEILMTLIVGLALHYPPDILNFVLVDYKGGGAFKAFERLPHCVDIVTNLNKAAVNRMFTAINAEIRRRQALNADTGTKDIVEYRKKNLHKTREAYPHLFIIIDEYAEMIGENPEYLAELESITRVGRAQGINLLLAAQRPKGVTDQMRANIKLKLCLRVEQIETSREMLRRPDAALLPSGMPGRGYLQVGNDNLELLQVSYTGDNQPLEEDTAVLWPNRPENTNAPSEETPKLYDAVVALTYALNDQQMAKKPWPSFLPQTFSLQSTLFDGQTNESYTLTTAVSDWLNDDTDHLWTGINWEDKPFQPIVGLLDEPAEARQTPLRFELNRAHYAIMGDSGWGKTSLLRTLIISLAAHYTPDEFHAYVLDLGGRNFRALEGLPHVGAIIYSDEEAYEERLQRLLDKLGRLVDERQHLLSEADANNLYVYNARNPEQALPAVLVAIDNFAELRENHELLVDNTLLPLVRRSLSAGVTFVVTGNAPNSMSSRFYALLGERVTFKQSNPDRYMEIVGRGAIDIADIAGRGYLRVGRQPLLFHTALPVGIFDAQARDHVAEGDELRRLAENMQRVMDTRPWQHQPDPIKILPEIVPLSDMLAQATAPSRRIQAVLGQNSRLVPALFDLQRMGPHFAIVGPPISGKTTTMYNWILSLASRYSPTRVNMVLIDMQGRLADYDGEQKLDELPHVLASITELEQMESLVACLKRECVVIAEEDSGRELFIFIDNFDDFVEELNRERELNEDLSTLARRYGRDGVHFVIAGALDSSMNELRRRVQSSNYGVGLRVAESLNTLRVQKHPAGIRGRELTNGRGYIVRSGQTTLIQVATPYDGMGVLVDDVEDPDEQEELRNARALDKWIAQIRAQYPNEQAEWVSGADGVSGGTGGSLSELSPEQKRMADTLQRYLQHEMATFDPEKQAQSALLTNQWVQLAPTQWYDSEAIMPLLREAYVRQLGLSAEMAPIFTSSMSDRDFVDGVLNALPEPEEEVNE